MSEENEQNETEAETPKEAEPAEPQEQLGPKERRRRARSTHRGEARPERTPEERVGERAEARRRKSAARRRRRAGEREARSGGEGTPPAEREPGTKKLRQGIVVSSRADKTITVQIESARRHPTYEKIVRRGTKLHAHDERNEAGEGDTVRVIESRPMSKTKRWRLVEVVEKAR
jgi:small subunit ribosomal protein S17